MYTRVIEPERHLRKGIQGRIVTLVAVVGVQGEVVTGRG